MAGPSVSTVLDAEVHESRIFVTPVLEELRKQNAAAVEHAGDLARLLRGLVAGLAQQ